MSFPLIITIGWLSVAGSGVRYGVYRDGIRIAETYETQAQVSVTSTGSTIYVTSIDDQDVESEPSSPIRVAAPPDITAARSGDDLALTISGCVGQSCDVQRSLDLSEWSSWQHITLGMEPEMITNANVLSMDHMFYRVQAQIEIQ